MEDKTVEEKVKVNNSFDLLKAPINSWVEINGKYEFKVFYRGVKVTTTLCEEGDYICKNHYNFFSKSLTPTYIEKFLKGAGGDSTILRFARMIEGDKK